MDSDQTITVEAICDIIGRRRIADAIGVRLTSVSNAVVDGRFPARWFHIMDGLCRAADLPCPRRLFSFLGADLAAPVDSNPRHNEFSHDPSEDSDAA